VLIFDQMTLGADCLGTGLRYGRPVNAAPRTAWSAGADSAARRWAGMPATAPTATTVTAEAFSAHHVSMKRSFLPREDLWLT
jgi:hypothetical protein